MDSDKLSKLYMEKYNELTSRFEELKINLLVEELNEAVSSANMDKTNELYNKILQWNAKVENLVGARKALNTQFRYLHLPSPESFGIIFDGEERVWKFNTEAI